MRALFFKITEKQAPNVKSASKLKPKKHFEKDIDAEEEPCNGSPKPHPFMLLQ